MAKDAANVSILITSKRVNLHFLANLLIKKHINLHKIAKFGSP
ncbi:hypothetical protein ATCC51561_1387 [Campylobacter concisus ATCC 51561]|nr:hypothetical protein ATCC51561_1387 [Campylobacter concisus ATCC 51561]